MVCRILEQRTNTSLSLPLYPIQKALDSLSYFVTTLWLFTASNFYSFAIPTVLFGFFGALSGPVLTSNSTPSLSSVLLRIPATVFIIWINLLVFDIGNQRSPSAVDEDRINKPHRPIPSGRITSEAARGLCLAFAPIVLAAGYYTHVESETLLLFVVSWMYNDLAGSDSHWFIRNMLVAVGYGLFSAIALGAMIGSDTTLNATGMQWIAVIMLVMLFTQVTDLKDSEGDRLKGRQTAPIVLGDGLCRWTIALPIIGFSAALPVFFKLGVMSYLFTLSFGGLVAVRTLMLRTIKADKLTWKLWALWTVSLFTLPLVSNPAALYAAWQSMLSLFCPGAACFDRLDIAAASCVALAFEAKRMISHAERKRDQSVPTIRIEGVVA